MPAPTLTETQRRRLGSLEPALREAVYSADYNLAKVLVADIQDLLRATGHETRLMRSKTWLFEATLNAGEVLTAEAGFRGIRSKTAEGTRVHLEATALLVVCLLRQRKVVEAEPLIAKLLHSKAIRDEKRRRRFIESVTVRFQHESFVAGIRGLAFENLNVDSVDADAIEAVKRKTEEELYSEIAAALPREVLELVFRVDKVARQQLTMKEVLYLPSPAVLERKAEQGRTFFESLKLVIWKSLCDPSSEIYRAWYTNGIAAVFSKKYYALVVTVALVDLGFAARAIAVPVTALLMKLGIEVYCEKYKPAEILDGRGEKEV